MDKQTVAVQVLYGALIGILFGFVNRLRDPDPYLLLSAGGMGVLAGSAFGGVVLYMILYRFWPNKKK